MAHQGEFRTKILSFSASQMCLCIPGCAHQAVLSGYYFKNNNNKKKILGNVISLPNEVTPKCFYFLGACGLLPLLSHCRNSTRRKTLK